MHAQACRTASGAVAAPCAAEPACSLVSYMPLARLQCAASKKQGLTAQEHESEALTNPIHDRFASMARVLLSA